MHDQSVPPSDRNVPAQFPCNEGLRERFRQLREADPDLYSNNKLARRLGYGSGSIISQWLNDGGNQYPGDIQRLEARAAEFLRSVEIRRQSGIETVAAGIYAELKSALEYIRQTGGVGAVYAESGEGKTRGLELYLRDNPRSVLFHVRSWTRDMGSIVGALFSAVGSRGYDHRTKREDFLVHKLRGSDRLLVVDDAHKLTSSALQWLYDFADESHCPLALVGTPELQKRVNADGQRASRTGIAWEIECAGRGPLLKHLVNELVPEAKEAGELEELVDLCEEATEDFGHFRNAEQQLRMARRQKLADAKLTWAQAFKQAGTLMPNRPAVKGGRS